MTMPAMTAKAPIATAGKTTAPARTAASLLGGGVGEVPVVVPALVVSSLVSVLESVLVPGPGGGC